MINFPIPYKETIYHTQHYALGVLHLLDKSFNQIPKHLYPKLINKSSTTKDSKLKLLISVSNNRDSCLLSNKSMAQIINLLGEKFEFDTYISAFHSDLDKAVSLNKEIIQHSTIKITPLLKDYIKLIGSMDICFLGEGGGMHMAAGLGIPQVVLFGHTSPTTWSPLNAKATIIKDISNVNNIPKKIILLALKNKLIKINSQKSGN